MALFVNSFCSRETLIKTKVIVGKQIEECSRIASEESES
jgi:hypothetical protein